MSKFKPDNHITGKVYDLTQENLNAAIAAWEAKVTELEEQLAYYQRRDDDVSDVIQGYKWAASIDSKRADSLEAENAKLREAIREALDNWFSAECAACDKNDVVYMRLKEALEERRKNPQTEEKKGTPL